MTARAFDVQRFAELRRERGVGWGDPLVYAPETGSTNDDALAAARASAATGSVFLADHQTQGRGRRGKTWVAAPGKHLLFSILLRDVAPRAASAVDAGAAPADGPAATGVGALTLAVGLGVRAALAAHARVPLAVKWPNDVLADSPADQRARKLAGILCEGQFVGSRLAAVVIGIGINVLEGSHPPELDGQLVCLEELASSGAASAPSSASSIEREAVLVEVLAAVEARVSSYLDAGFGALLDEFSRHDALASERVEVSGAAPIQGIARGVDATGRLLVESDGLLVPVISGTVRLLR